MTTLPDLDNDTLTYSFRKVGSVGYTNTYAIWRSINGRPEQKIGTVVKTRDGGWDRSASWTAVGTDEEIRAIGDTRALAVRSLEARMQPGYHERKLQEWNDERAAHAARQAAEKAADEDLIRAMMSRWPAIAEHLAPLQEDAGRFTLRSITPQQVIDMLNALETS